MSAFIGPDNLDAKASLLTLCRALTVACFALPTLAVCELPLPACLSPLTLGSRNSRARRQNAPLAFRRLRCLSLCASVLVILLKGVQLHAVSRCVHFGRLGRLDQRDFERQTGAASCLLLIHRSYHLLADSGDRSCFERGGLGCRRSRLRVTDNYTRPFAAWRASGSSPSRYPAVLDLPSNSSGVRVAIACLPFPADA